MIFIFPAIALMHRSTLEKQGDEMDSDSVPKTIAYVGAKIEPDIRSGKTLRKKSKSVSFSFKLPFEFRQQFKLQALRRNMTMTELLVAAIESYIAANPIPTFSDKEIRK